MGWADHLAAADAVVAGYFDDQAFQAFGYAKPVRDVNAKSQPDPTRAPFAFMGTLEVEPDMSAIGSTQFPTARSPGDRAVARICLTALVTSWPWVPVKDDQIQAAGGQRYIVTARPERDGTERAVFWLAKVRP